LLARRGEAHKMVCSSSVTVIGPDIGEAEVVSLTHDDVQVVDDGEGLGVVVGGFCTLDDRPVPGTSDSG
jgi:hypothetical protein